MSTPGTYSEWAQETFEAFEHAVKALEKGTSPVKELYNLFRHAPVIAAGNRGIITEGKVQEMLDNTVRDIEYDFTIDQHAQKNYLFHFVLSYIQSHAYGDFISEMEADRIMNYINCNYQLFHNR